MYNLDSFNSLTACCLVRLGKKNFWALPKYSYLLSLECCIVFEQAYSCIEELRSNAPKVSVSTFVNQRALEAIHRALGIPFKDEPVSPSNGYHGYAVNGDDEDDGEIVDEDVAAD